jgi:hypothetical protein
MSLQARPALTFQMTAQRQRATTLFATRKVYSVEDDMAMRQYVV